MRKRDRKALRAYIRRVADALALRDWQIDLLAGPAPDGCNGHVSITYGRKVAEITVAQDFRTHDPRDQVHTIVHELIHCHLEPACALVHNHLEEHLGKTADKLFWEAFKHQVEYGVDGLADAIAGRFPKIDWP